MELTAAEVDQIEGARQTVEDLIEYAEDHDTDVLDKRNLVVLEVQLEALHQALSLAVAQKKGLSEENIGGDGGD